MYRVEPSGAATVLHEFNGADGESSVGSIVQVPGGALYGTMTSGGAHGSGTVFKISPGGQFTSVHSFSGGDGGAPIGLFLATDGLLYGTTLVAGQGHGSAFTLDPASDTFSVLRHFDGSVEAPGRLIEGAEGFLYGLSRAGGSAGQGTLFRLDRQTGEVTVVYSFHSGIAEGNYLNIYSLVQGSDGAFYGTKSDGGAFDRGTVFKVDLAGQFTLLHSFSDESTGLLSYDQQGSLVRARDGHIYGTTHAGGSGHRGTIFKVDGTSGAVTLVHAFGGPPTAGSTPRAGLVMGNDGHLYGTTERGGSANLGTLFRLAMPRITTLTVITQVINDDGGTAAPGDFTVTVTGTDATPASAAGTGAPGVTVTLSAGPYDVSASALTGYGHDAVERLQRLDRRRREPDVHDRARRRGRDRRAARPEPAQRPDGGGDQRGGRGRGVRRVGDRRARRSGHGPLHGRFRSDVRARIHRRAVLRHGQP